MDWLFAGMVFVGWGLYQAIVGGRLTRPAAKWDCRLFLGTRVSGKAYFVISVMAGAVSIAIGALTALLEPIRPLLPGVSAILVGSAGATFSPQYARSAVEWNYMLLNIRFSERVYQISFVLAGIGFFLLGVLMLLGAVRGQVPSVL
jgi:hypothetical protein